MMGNSNCRALPCSLVDVIPRTVELFTRSVVSFHLRVGAISYPSLGKVCMAAGWLGRGDYVNSLLLKLHLAFGRYFLPTVSTDASEERRVISKLRLGVPANQLRIIVHSNKTEPINIDLWGWLLSYLFSLCKFQEAGIVHQSPIFFRGQATALAHSMSLGCSASNNSETNARPESRAHQR